MSFLDDLRKTKNRIKIAVINFFHRARGIKQDKNVADTVNPAPERPPSPVGSNWDSDDGEELVSNTRTFFNGRHEAVTVEKKGGFHQTGRKSPEPVRKVGGKQSSSRGPNAEVPGKQWKDTHDDTFVTGQCKRMVLPTTSKISSGGGRSRRQNQSEREDYQERVVRPLDIPRPKCSYRRSRPSKPQPLKPQMSIRAAGFVSRKPESVSKVRYTRNSYKPDPHLDQLLDFEDVNQGKESRKAGVERRERAGETPRIIYGKDNTECTSNGTSARKESFNVESVLDPLDGLDELLSEFERPRANRNFRRAAPKLAPPTPCESDRSKSWASTERNGSMDSVWEPVERMKKQRADRKKELMAMERLLEEMDD